MHQRDELTMRKSKVTESIADKATTPEPQAVDRSRSTRIPRTPEVERAFGARIRMARVAAKMSQNDLGQAVGISFQQIQKYELGKDRVSVGNLQRIADALGLHPGSFFNDDMPVPVGDTVELREVVRFAEVLQQIRNPRVLKQLLALAKVLADEEKFSKDAPRTAEGD